MWLAVAGVGSILGLAAVLLWAAMRLGSAREREKAKAADVAILKEQVDAANNRPGSPADLAAGLLDGRYK